MGKKGLDGSVLFLPAVGSGILKAMLLHHFISLLWATADRKNKPTKQVKTKIINGFG